jgi:GxxExxY protein
MQKSRSVKGYDFESLSYEVIGACIDVQRQLGSHCKEEDYQRAVVIAFEKRGLQFEREANIPVLYDGVEVAQKRVDFRVWDGATELLLETKARNSLSTRDRDQILQYLEIGENQLGLLVNFGEIPLGIRRFVYTPDKKTTK